MDPEYEVAMKISEYLEFLWDGQVDPEWQESAAACGTWPGLLPRRLGTPAFREPVTDNDISAVTEAIRSFLDRSPVRKSRLRRAAKAAGLWMSPAAATRDGQFADRYVPPRDADGGTFLDTNRRYRPADSFDEGKVLEEIARYSSELIARDVIALAHIFGNERVWAPLPEEGGNALLAMQSQLATYFFERPRFLSRVATALQYLPSFPARVAAALAATAPPKGLPGGRWRLEAFLYSRAKSLLHLGTSVPLDMVISGAVRMRNQSDPGKPEIPRDRVLTAIRAVRNAPKRQAAGWPAPAHRPRPPGKPVTEPQKTGEQFVFEIVVCLLRNKRVTVRLADAFRIPVPFGVTLAEELLEVDRSRSERLHLADNKEMSAHD